MPEIWRLATPFWLTGGGLSILFDTYFLWTYSSALEKDSPRFNRPGDFFTYIFFLEVFILLTAGGIFRYPVFLSALVLGLAYTYSQDNKGKKARFFIVTFNVIWLPWAMLLLTLVMGGPRAAMIQGTGLLAAHLYDFLTRLYPTFGGGRNYIFTPEFVKRWFGGDRPSVNVKGYGTAFVPAATAQRSSTRGTSTGIGGFSGTWGTRGQGRRLGGD
ncbi:hypothetical protein MMC07_005533 [Pseudocyphellaria aurata]|nr:hypothetical protein [Pseudocyphellaria aurata]